MAFLSLPLEIQAMVIPRVSSIGDLAALSRSCRSIHRLCDMKTRERCYQIRVEPKDYSINKTFDLVMEILKKPQLGNYVREIVQTREPSMEHHYVQTAEQRELSAGDRGLLRAAVQKAGFAGSQESAVFNMLMQNITKPPGEITEPFRFPITAYGYDHGEIHGTFIAQALAAILISVSPNLESLVMTQPFSVFSGFYSGFERPQDDGVQFPLHRLLSRANANPASIAYLQNLRKVYMIVDDRNSDYRFYMALDFLECATLFDRLPSIESISTDALCDDENAEARVVLEPRSSNISRIHIRHSALPTTFLVSLIQSCKVLREFQYTIGGRCVLGGWYVPFKARTFIKSICPHKDTLEVLDIDAENNMHYFQPSYFEEGRVDQGIDQSTPESDNDDDDERQMLRSFSSNSGSLKEFRALKRLSVGIGFLVYFAMGVRKNNEPRQPFLLPEALPESLEYLCIRGYEKGKCKKWDAHIDALVASFVSGSSGIKEIVGIEEIIPNSEDVEDPDNNEDLLWIPMYSVDD
ncbi:uncharacterized protein N7498_002280 [Penicillium cinerascens]|uniref:F-box domain-containing protein n=1 Tax=Penicillium cinerascens TaxID=70096 RepID=A0A9W9NBA0_9EURO|nr:uncharacterized protein N7498_002280 [Penicillium cinerascens]KAJ5215873.1 hypothetical protein N7498_002280 [Penicillium cinerascens]